MCELCFRGFLMTPPSEPQLIIFSSLSETAHSVSHMATNRLSHVDLYCCMSQIARFYGNQYIYFAQKLSVVSGYSRRTPSSSGKAWKTPDFSWQTFASFVKNTQQIFWWVSDAFIVENSSDKLLSWPEMTTLTCFLRLRIYRTAAKADQTECGHRECGRVMETEQHQGQLPAVSLSEINKHSLTLLELPNSIFCLKDSAFRTL